MSFLIYGLGARDAVKVKDCEMIETSFPSFIDLMNDLGGKIVRNPEGVFKGERLNIRLERGEFTVFKD